VKYFHDENFEGDNFPRSSQRAQVIYPMSMKDCPEFLAILCVLCAFAGNAFLFPTKRAKGTKLFYAMSTKDRCAAEFLSFPLRALCLCGQRFFVSHEARQEHKVFACEAFAQKKFQLR